MRTRLKWNKVHMWPAGLTLISALTIKNYFHVIFKNGWNWGSSCPLSWRTTCWRPPDSTLAPPPRQDQPHLLQPDRAAQEQHAGSVNASQDPRPGPETWTRDPDQRPGSETRTREELRPASGFLLMARFLSGFLSCTLPDKAAPPLLEVRFY